MQHSKAQSPTHLKGFLNGPFPASFSLFVFSIQLTINKCLRYIKVFQWLDSNCGPLVLEPTTLPTEPQPLPKCPVNFSQRFLNEQFVGQRFGFGERRFFKWPPAHFVNTFCFHFFFNFHSGVDSIKLLACKICPFWLKFSEFMMKISAKIWP